MRVVLQHFFRDVPCNAADRLVACLSFRKLCDRVVTQVVETECRERAFYVANIGFTFFRGFASVSTGDTGPLLSGACQQSNIERYTEKTEESLDVSAKSMVEVKPHD